jgi:hypothetical protein
MSKLAENIWSTRILPKMPMVMQKQIQVYCLDPGNVATEMNNFKGELSIEEGIKTPAYLIELPPVVDPKLQGQYFEKCKVSTIDLKSKS